MKIGERRGDWIVRAYIGGERRYWRCECKPVGRKCGRIKHVRQDSLLLGTSKNCGCAGSQRRLIDISGKQYNNWTVIKLSRIQNKKSYWLCRCSCGVEQVVRSDNLKEGSSTGCGDFSRHNNLTGQSFGDWTVLRYARMIDERPHWLVRCSCGKEREVNHWSLTRGLSTTCGHNAGKKLFQDLSGQDYGSWRVLHRLPNAGNARQFKCLCTKCGNEKPVLASNLVADLSTSCGCEQERPSTSQYITLCKIVHADRYDYSKTVYLGSDKLVEIICPLHGSFKIYGGNHLLRGQGCSFHIGRGRKTCGSTYKKPSLTASQQKRFNEIMAPAQRSLEAFVSVDKAPKKRRTRVGNQAH